MFGDDETDAANVLGGMAAGEVRFDHFCVAGSLSCVFNDLAGILNCAFNDIDELGCHEQYYRWYDPSKRPHPGRL